MPPRVTFVPAELGGGSLVAALQAGGFDPDPWRSFLAPEQVHAMLGQHGFTVLEHVRQRDAVPGRLWERSDPIRPTELSMITRAVREPTSAG